MKRVFDIFLGFLAALILFVLVLFVAITVRLTSKGSVMYWFDRVGCASTSGCLFTPDFKMLNRDKVFHGCRPTGNPH
jgi:hypothetical protein